MASVLHGSARTTPRIRAELKAAKTPARLLASQYRLNVKAVHPKGPKLIDVGGGRSDGALPVKITVLGY